MQELSMNILDIAQNSVKAGAALVEIGLLQDTAQRVLELSIKDDGSGMSAEMAARVTDPFCTSRTTRKVGLGLPFLKMAAEMTGGGMHIESAPGAGTLVRATFTLGHIDLAPLGDIGGTISALAQCNPDMDFIYRFARDGQEFVFDTREAREMLGGVPLSEPQVALFIKDYVQQHTDALLQP